MWIFTRYGFYSVACVDFPGTRRINPDVVMVRARVRKHLVNLQQRFPSLALIKIFTLPGRDYAFRFVVAKAVWAEAVKELVEEQTWSNFKNEAQDRAYLTSPRYVSLLHEVWRVMIDLEWPFRSKLSQARRYRDDLEDDPADLDAYR
jgi:hypothetical protein